MRFVILIIVLGVRCYSQTANFPLQVGNRWEYAYPPLGGGQATYLVATVLKDTTLPSGQTYALIRTSSNFAQPFDEMYRQSGDTVFRHEPHLHRDVRVLDFSMNIGDTLQTAATGEIVLETLQVVNLYGTQRRVWSFKVDPERQAIDDEFSLLVADSIGIIAKGMSMGFSYDLQGAVIGGRVFGSVNALRTNPHLVYDDFQLSQNYPNPFNSNTTIDVRVPGMLSITIDIVNPLGELLRRSSYTAMQGGVHTVALDFSRWSTGSYFCRVSSKLGSHTRRMIYLK